MAEAAFVSCGGGASAPRRRRREVVVNGKRVKTVDVHAHCAVPAAMALVGAALEAEALLMSNTETRIRAMDEQGIDVEALSINPYWYTADRDVARKLIEIQNETLAEICAAQPDRFVAFATVALQHPDLAVEQVEQGIKRYGLRGVSLGGSVEGTELSDPKFHPFWAKVEALGVLVFIHPQGTAELERTGRLQGNGLLTNTIGNPLETTIALSHLIFEGTLDRFPGLKICAAHGGGYLPSYAARSNAVQTTFPQRMTGTLKKRPTEYLRQLLLRLDRLHARGPAPPGRGGGTESDRDGHGLSLPVDVDVGGSHPGHAGAQRRRQDRHAGRHRPEAARGSPEPAPPPRQADATAATSELPRATSAARRGGYISSLMRARATSGATPSARCASGPPVCSTGSSSSSDGRSVRCQKRPIGISSPHW